MGHLGNVSELQWTDQQSSFLIETIQGLSSSPKRLSCKHFYDQRGSELFNQICDLEEYYLTRSELEIMRQFADEIGTQLGERVRLVEYGSGSSVKTRILLDHLRAPVAYVPVDISREHLLAVAEHLQSEYPAIEVLPVVADFTSEFSIPDPTASPSHTAVYFPGSTIGNFETHQVRRLLRNIACLCGRDGGLLIGIDLEKNKSVLELAYNDSAGVTAAFNLNLLHRMRRELDAEVDLDGFEHHAFYNPQAARIEIYIRSLRDQTIEIAGNRIKLKAGELIHTEYSHKYTVERFARLAAAAGLTLRKSWTDSQQYFAVLHCVVGD